MINEFKIVEKIVVLNKKLMGSLDAHNQLLDELTTPLADSRDYFIYKVLDTKQEDAVRTIEFLDRFQSYCEKFGDDFHAGFFFALAQLLQHKYETAILPSDAITREDFEKSWAKTKKKLNLEGK